MKRLVAALSLLALTACGEGDVTELSRITSPNGAWDAIVVRVQATRGKESPYMVLMGPKGIGNGKAARVFLADRTGQPEVAWEDDAMVAIRCDKARVWSYHNFFNAPDGAAAVGVKLACGAGGYQPS